MTKLWFRHPTAGDIFDVCRAMSPVDAVEVFALKPHEDRDAIARELYAVLPHAIAAYAIGLDNRASAEALLCVWPTYDETGGVVTASLIGTNDFPRIAARLARWARETFIPNMIERNFRRAECRVWKEHTGARNFIRRSGAVEEAELPDFGKNGETYILCAWRRSDFAKGAI